MPVLPSAVLDEATRSARRNCTLARAGFPDPAGWPSVPDVRFRKLRFQRACDLEEQEEEAGESSRRRRRRRRNTPNDGSRAPHELSSRNVDRADVARSLPMSCRVVTQVS
jgi:hypothetical protein